MHLGVQDMGSLISNACRVQRSCRQARLLINIHGCDRILHIFAARYYLISVQTGLFDCLLFHRRLLRERDREREREIASQTQHLRS